MSQRTTVLRMEKNVKQPLSTHELYAQKIFILDLDLLSLAASPFRCARPLEITVFCSTEKSDIFSSVEKWEKKKKCILLNLLQGYAIFQQLIFRVI